jgi:D-alanyl-D-alanine carboxypeptidase (penicillin-binding protein 5/6)
MNKKALELGASSTSFTNVSGIHDPKMVTTARDILKISLAAAKNELFVNIGSTYTYIVNFAGGSTRTVENRNMLHVPKDFGSKWYNSNAYGLCAGMTDEGGYCISVKGVFGDAQYVCIIMGAEEDKEYELATKLLSWASETYSLFTLRKKGEKVGDIPVTLSGTHSQTALRLESSINVLLEKNAAEDGDNKYVLSLDKPFLAAPVEKGERVGYMNVWQNGRLIACVGVIVSEDIEKNPFLSFMESIKSFLVGNALRASLVFLAIIIVIMLIISYIKPKIRRKKYRVRLR